MRFFHILCCVHVLFSNACAESASSSKTTTVWEPKASKSKSFTSTVADISKINDEIHTKRSLVWSTRWDDLDYHTLVTNYAEEYGGKSFPKSDIPTSATLNPKFQEISTSTYFVVAQYFDLKKPSSLFGTAVAVSEKLAITAAHNILLDDGRKNDVSLYFVCRDPGEKCAPYYRDIGLEYLEKHCFRCVPHDRFLGDATTDDIGFLKLKKKSDKFPSHLTLSTTSDLPQFVGCYGFRGGVTSRAGSRTGKPLDTDVYDEFYGTFGCPLVSVGKVINIDEEYKRTCAEYVLPSSPSDVSTQAECMAKAERDRPTWTKARKRSVFVENNIPEGVSGGMCFNLLNPSELVAIASCGRDVPVEGVTGDEERFGVANQAFLLSKSPSVEEYLTSSSTATCSEDGTCTT